MAEEEVVLAGSRLNRVVRIGDTVRRPAGPWTPTVHALLQHVRQNGFDLAPEPLGIDDRGREVLVYIPGHSVGDSLPWPAWVWDDGLLAGIGRATADYHRAVSGFRPTGAVPWQSGPAELSGDQIVCHHDIAPYNTVVAAARLQGIIDWDLSGPGTAGSDLAFVAWQWIPLQHPAVARMFGWHDVGDLGRRLRLLLDAYGLDDRDGFVDDVITRMHLNRDLMVRKAAEGSLAYRRLVEEGHVDGMNAAISFVTSERDVLQSALT